MPTADEPTPVVTVEGLTRRFGSQRGVTDVSFQVANAEVFGFLGPNGAGKSTTIRLLLGLYRPTSGRTRVFGLDPLTDSVEIHRRVGYLPGELALFPQLTGRQHLDRLGRMRAMTDLRYRDELVGRFSAELDRPVRTLSKGNRQKIGLVLAFMHRPALLVLDEPTSGLDPLLQDQFARLVRETVADGRTVFLSSHELDEVQRVVDRLAIIKDGRIVVTDTVDGLRRAAPRTVEFRLREHGGPTAVRRPGRGTGSGQRRRAHRAVDHRPGRGSPTSCRQPRPSRHDRPPSRPGRTVPELLPVRSPPRDAPCPLRSRYSTCAFGAAH